VDPAINDGGGIFVICRSAIATTVVIALLVLLPRFVSMAVGPTLALSIIVPACADDCATTVIVLLDPLVRAVPKQAVAGQVKPAPVALTNVPPVNARVTAGLAVSGPLLLMETA
jgi:hypothetical protein